MISKITIVLYFLFLSNLFLSQKRESIYLEFGKPSAVSKDKNIIVEIYKLNFIDCGEKVTRLNLDENNRITKQVSIKSSSKPSLVFTYNSLKNPVKKVADKNINFLSIQELQNIESTSLVDMLRNFKNIFIIDKKKSVKKVSYEVLGNL
ncbi:hypothetical protein [Chryseobacterium sp.]|uniref:hypothetical protein n=1 Tax=Chryseobacterium sp. TaxID=1871047 RepID=UPI0012A8D6B7|nr:hypothetical protein [Chryseobacterium sp.]QFG54140.1 hypothetical protein F7R58_11505 [Chryseobacterium sp.]